MRIVAHIAIISLLLTLAAAAQDLQVGTARAVAGQKTTGEIQVPAGVDPATNIPVEIIRGAKPGPVLALVAGSHGTEYASIIALQKLIQHIDPARMSGTLIVIPLVNLPSFQKKVPHVNPIDNKSMNRFYPGDMNGTQTDRASWMITKEVVEKSDYLIDFHGGDLDESLRPYSYWSPTGKAKQDAVSKDMVLAFGLDTIIIVRDRPTDINHSRFLDNTASLRGKPTVTVEAGHAGTVEAIDVDALIDGSFNVMRYLKMLPGEAKPVANPVWIERIANATSDQAGTFYPLVKRGTYASQGMKIGYLTDYLGNKVADITAPAGGVVLYICAVPTMNKGDTVANIGVIAAQAP